MTNKETIEKLKPLFPYLESAAFAKYVRMMYNNQINTLKEVYEAKGFKLADRNCSQCVVEMCSRLYKIFKEAEQEEAEATIQRPEKPLSAHGHPLGSALHAHPGRSTGFVRFQDIVKGDVRPEQEGRHDSKRIVADTKGDKHPRIMVEDANGTILDFHHLPAKARIEVQEGQRRARHPACPPAARNCRYPGHHRRSAPCDRNLRGPVAEGAFGHGGDLGHGRAAHRQLPRQDDHRGPPLNPAWKRSTTRCRQAALRTLRDLVEVGTSDFRPGLIPRHS